MTDIEPARGNLPWTLPDLTAATTTELFTLYGQVMAQLLSRGLIRTANAPAGDYAEFLVNKAVAGKLADNSEKSFDLVSEEFGRVQVKARVVSDPIKSSQRQTSPFRSDAFDHAAFVLLSSDDYHVVCARMVPMEAVAQAWVWRRHVNGHIAFMRPALLDHPEAHDLTDRLRQAARQEVR